jgi:hypothetical protein
MRVYADMGALLRHLADKEPPGLVRSIALLALQIEVHNWVRGDVQALAEKAACGRNTMTRHLLRMRAHQIAVYDERTTSLEFNPHLVFEGAEQERRRAIERWSRRRREMLSIVT